MWADPPSPAKIRAAAAAARRIAPPPAPSPDGTSPRSGRRAAGREEPSETVIRRRLDADLDPAVVAPILQRRPGFCWLDGDRPRLYVDPVAVLESRGGRSSIRGTGGQEEVEIGGFDLLEGALEAWGRPVGVELVGHLGYELAGELEALPPTPPDDTGVPDLRLGLYDIVLRCGPEGRELVATRGWREPGELEELIDGLTAELEGARGRGGPAGGGDSGPAAAPVSPFGEHLTADATSESDAGTSLRSRPDRRGYVDAVARSVARIRHGELFQVNLCRRLELPGLHLDPLDLYLAWRGDRPATRAAFVSLGDGEAILSASPETFLRVRDGRVTTRPIKGTRPRGDTAAEDRALVEELLASPKDRAELSMIVDLMRNDLGRVCRTGTVRVDDHFRAFRLPTVHHTVSTVSGRLRSDVGPAGLLRATFPAGSITGAPKIRAMEIIAEEEECRRGPAMGAIGRISPGGDLDLSVAIRTSVAVGGRLVYHAGAGIVADSDPEREWHETRAKALGFLSALGLEGMVDDEGAAVP